MVYNILNAYKKLFSLKNMYLKYFKKRILILYLFLSLIAVTIFISSFILDISWLLILILVPLILFFLIHTYEIKRIIREEYKLKNRSEVNEKLKKDFYANLKVLNIDINNNEQLGYLIDLIELKRNDIKPKIYIKSGILAGILGPIWINYINTIFKLSLTIYDATVLFLQILFIFILLYMYIYSIKHVIIDDILYSDYYRMQQMNNVLRDYKLVYMNKKFPQIY